jgi:hypothetical protein
MTIFVLFLPLVGVLTYLIVRGEDQGSGIPLTR